MHEMTVARSLVEEILNNIERLTLKGKEIERVEKVTLDIGELAFISERQLGFCYDLLANEQDVLKGSELVMNKVKAEVRCIGCDFGGDLGSLEEPADHRIVMSFTCPRCGETLDIIKGRGMVLSGISMRLKEEDEGSAEEVR